MQALRQLLLFVQKENTNVHISNMTHFVDFWMLVFSKLETTGRSQYSDELKLIYVMLFMID